MCVQIPHSKIKPRKIDVRVILPEPDRGSNSSRNDDNGYFLVQPDDFEDLINNEGEENEDLYDLPPDWQFQLNNFLFRNDLLEQRSQELNRRFVSGETLTFWEQLILEINSQTRILANS